jgi:hypothetical protein
MAAVDDRSARYRRDSRSILEVFRLSPENHRMAIATRQRPEI